MTNRILIYLFSLLFAGSVAAENVLVEAESFAEPGGWMLDTQFIQIMGSPYLIAHGMGRPVEDATTTVKFSKPGTYRMWVRTKDWVAPWGAEGAPGRFQVAVGGKTVAMGFGAAGPEWLWDDGVEVEVAGMQAEVELKDLT